MEASVDFGIHFVWVRGVLVRALSQDEYDRLVYELKEQIRKDEKKLCEEHYKSVYRSVYGSVEPLRP